MPGRFSIDLAAGPSVGVIAGLAEFAVHRIARAPLLLPSLLPGMLLLYIFYWSILGFLLALFLGIIRHRRGADAVDARTGPAILAAAALSLSIHAALVSNLLVDLRRPWSTILFSLALLAIPLFAAAFKRAIPRFLIVRPLRTALLSLLPILLALPLQFLPEAAGERRPVPATARGGPNMILVVFDTLRFDHVGAYGYGRETTPAIDSLAGEGTLFERAYAPSSWTLPSTASILTSKYPSGHGAVTRSSALSPEIETLPALLREAGYRTGLFSGNPFVEPNFGFGNGFSHIVSPVKPLYMKIFYLPCYYKRTIGRVPFFPKTNDWVTAWETLWRPSLEREWIEGDELVDRLLRWVRADDGRPFFAHLQIMEPHDPYVGVGRFGEEGISLAPHVGFAPLYPFHTLAPRDPEALALLVDRYDDDVWVADGCLASLREGLDRLGLAGETWLVITSDHGEEFWDHDGWGHGNSLFDELIRVPLIFHGEGVAAGRVRSMARLVDIAPTLADAAGVETPEGFAGKSLYPVLVGATSETGVRESFAELHRAGTNRAWAIVLENGRKLIRVRSGNRERLLCYDLAEDNREKRNLEEEDPDLAGSLRSNLEKAIERAALDRAIPATAEIDAVTERRLRALGYIE